MRPFLIRIAATLFVVVFFSALAFVKFPLAQHAAASPPSTPLSGYAWNDHTGWISFSGAGYSVSVTGTTLSGYAWSDGAGWISFNTSDLSGCPSGTCSAQLVGTQLIGWAKICSGAVCSGSDWLNLAAAGASSPVTIYLTSGSSWTVPSDWNSSNNTIEVIGGGGGGAGSSSIFSTRPGTGGGGGGYSKVTNVSLPPGAPVSYQIGAGGSAGAAGSNGGDGTDTYLCNSTSNCASIAGSAVQIGAKGGAHGVQVPNLLAAGGGAGGGGGPVFAASTTFSGGSGGTSSAGAGRSGTGGGGAASSHGAGKAGGAGTGIAVGGTGGGGSGGGTAGAVNAGAAGGVGGNNFNGLGGGARNTAGTLGGGGGGGDASATVAGAGGAGQEWDSSHGSGGGGGGGGGNGNGGAGGLYGGGGGGGVGGGGGATGAAGAQGIIVITYTPSGVAYGPTLSGSNFSGYAWSDLLGWVDFSQVKYGVDICTDITGIQSFPPTGCQVPNPNPGTCIPSGYTYDGTQCVVVPAQIITFSASPTRTRKNVPTTVTFTWKVLNPPTPPDTCLIKNPDGSTLLTISPADNATQSQSTSITISQSSTYTLSCGSSPRAQATITLVPTVQEI